MTALISATSRPDGYRGSGMSHKFLAELLNHNEVWRFRRAGAGRPQTANDFHGETAATIRTLRPPPREASATISTSSAGSQDGMTLYTRWNAPFTPDSL